MSIQEVWAVWPCVNEEVAETSARRWREAGYCVAVLLDGDEERTVPSANVVMRGGEYRGFPIAVNKLLHAVSGPVVVVPGHDVFPHVGKAPQEIAEEFYQRFPDTYGVMQPIGDQFGSYRKCATSPWVGRAFIERAYEGLGPYWPEYFHYFCDQELQDKAVLDKAFWQRTDLLHFHQHWQREDPNGRPAHLMKALSLWEKGRNLYRLRKSQGFPAILEKDIK